MRISPVAEGELEAKDCRVALVVSRFNDEITESLLEGAVGCLERHGASRANLTVLRVPGAWEIPPVARKAAASGRHDAVIALGALIRGETPHFDVLADEVARGLGQVAMQHDVPVIFGVLTTDDAEQARARSGSGSDNKGAEAALAALEMIHLYRRMA